MLRMLRRSEGGYVLVTALLALAVMAILATAVFAQASSALKLAREATESEQALYTANAGTEMILALVQNGEMPELDPFRYSGTIPIGPGLAGAYEVLVTVPRDDVFRVYATGRVGDHLRSIEAEIPAVIELPPPGPGDSPVLAFGNGPLAFKNVAEVCGDLYAVGDISLGNGVTVWGRTTAEDPASPCSSLNGTGRVVATGTLTMGNKTEIQGGWCDQAHPCDPMPVVQTLPPPDFPALKNEATEWYLRPDDADFCLDKPVGTCTILDKRRPVLTLSGEKAYPNALVYVDADLVVPKESLVVGGSVRFAVTGKVSLDGDVRCAPGSDCAVTLIAGQDLSVANNKRIWAHLQTEGRLTIDSAVTIHGNLVARRMDAANGLVLYPQKPAVPPPVVPGEPPPIPVTPPAGTGYLYWRQ